MEIRPRRIPANPKLRKCMCIKQLQYGITCHNSGRWQPERTWRERSTALVVGRTWLCCLDTPPISAAHAFAAKKQRKGPKNTPKRTQTTMSESVAISEPGDYRTQAMPRGSSRQAYRGRGQAIVDQLDSRPGSRSLQTKNRESTGSWRPFRHCGVKSFVSIRDPSLVNLTRRM